MLRDYFLLACKNLRYRGIRSWLTMLGIFIGIAAVVSLISLGQGLQDAINEQFQELGSDKIIIQSKTIGPPGSATNKALILTTKDLEVIKNTRGVEDAAGILIKTGPAEFNDEINIGFMIGYDQYYEKLVKDTMAGLIIEGRTLKKSDQSKILVGYNHVYGDTWDKPVKLNDNIQIEGRNFKVVGVLKKTGNPFDDNAYYVQKEVLKELLNVEDEESQIIAKTQRNHNPVDVAKNIEKKLRKSRGEKEGQETFQVQTSEQLLQTITNIFNIIQVVLVGIAGISLLVGGIGIMNTMYTSVLERTKEIGIMKAIGAKNSDIFTIFLMESGMLGLMGGLIGVLIGIGMSKSVEIISTNIYGITLIKASLNPYLIIGALMFSFVVGSISGVFPALQASKLKPIDALRYE